MKKLLKVLLGISLVIALLSAPLLLSGSLRDKTFRTAVELPTIFNYLRLRGTMINRDFPLAARYLEQQLGLVESFATGNNTMIPGLLANTRFVVDQAVFDKDFKALRPYLERLAGYREGLFPARLWLAQAILATDPEKVFAHTDAAARMIPTDERPYRIAIEAALKTGELNRIGKLCRRYQDARLGGYHFFERNTLFGGVGFREFGLEINGGKDTSAFKTNSGPDIGENISYEFQFDAPLTVDSLRLHFAMPPGLVVRVEQITFFLEGKQQAELTKETFTLSSLNGFSAEGGIVTTTRGKETLSVFLKNPQTIEADQVAVRLTVFRLALLAHPACEGVR